MCKPHLGGCGLRFDYMISIDSASICKVEALHSEAKCLMHYSFTSKVANTVLPSAGSKPGPG